MTCRDQHHARCRDGLGRRLSSNSTRLCTCHLLRLGFSLPARIIYELCKSDYNRRIFGLFQRCSGVSGDGHRGGYEERSSMYPIAIHLAFIPEQDGARVDQ